MPRRPGRRSERKAIVSVSLPIHLLDELDDLIDEGVFQSRSGGIEQALETLIAKIVKRQTVVA